MFPSLNADRKSAPRVVLQYIYFWLDLRFFAGKEKLQFFVRAHWVLGVTNPWHTTKKGSHSSTEEVEENNKEVDLLIVDLEVSPPSTQKHSRHICTRR